MDFGNYHIDMEESELYNKVNSLVSQNQSAFFMFVFYLVTLVVYAMYNNRLSSKLEHLDSELDLSVIKNHELRLENSALEDRVEELKEEITDLDRELEKFKTQIRQLQERNQSLCESLGEFLRYKKRKPNDLFEQQPTHTYNLRKRKHSDFKGTDLIENDSSDSDYEPNDLKSK